ncbi:Hypothetical predicted protein [Olea europaea subsp. europaea]|uniref:Uncharacterized protein n=1 Tax=Olea europaea subsp. europaea TaxID=158383 RepID=A0A8S0TFX5_OLEEU|nr:Hypothetical predicted protein [Olea europaea subsp. europaea]
MSARTQNQNPAQRDYVLQEEDEEEEVLKLEEEVEQITQKVLEYRTKLPNQLNSTHASLLSSQRPIIPPTRLSENGSEPRLELETGPNPGACVHFLVIHLIYAFTWVPAFCMSLLGIVG